MPRPLPVLLICLLAVASVAAQKPQRENALRERVEQFYAFLQVGQKAQAEKFLV